MSTYTVVARMIPVATVMATHVTPHGRQSRRLWMTNRRISVLAIEYTPTRTPSPVIDTSCYRTKELTLKERRVERRTRTLKKKIHSRRSNCRPSLASISIISLHHLLTFATVQTTDICNLQSKLITLGQSLIRLAPPRKIEAYDRKMPSRRDTG